MATLSHPRNIRIPSGRRFAAFAAIAPAGVLSACNAPLSALDPRGPVAGALAETWWVLLVGGAAIFVLVMALALYAVFRSYAKRLKVDGNFLIVAGGVALPVAALSALLLYAVQVGRRVHMTPPDALRIEVIGRQWWWEVRYPDHPGAVTANEIHIPVGRPVVIEVVSADVIHSFWVPRLAGKVDVLPEQRNRLWLQADAAGVFRGRCSEFCGAPHAHMSKLVIAQPQADFEVWLARQQRPARAPASPAQQRGLAAFEAHRCYECHSIRGVKMPPHGDLGPDLTHVGARRTLAAATLANTTENLRAWVGNSQKIKPGNFMPPVDEADPDTIADLVAFLQNLK